MSNDESIVSLMDGYPPIGTVDDAAEFLKMKPERVRAMCRSGELHALKCGALWRIPRAWLADFIAQGVVHNDR